MKRDLQAAMFELYGQRYTEYRKQWQDENFVVKDGPLHIDIDLQDACNQYCATCHQSYRRRTGEVISVFTMEKTIHEAARLGLCSVNIGASSEPLLQPELLFKALDFCNEYDVMDIFIHTNGILLSESIFAELMRRNVKCICISVDAAKEDTYKKMRRSGSLLLIENIINKIMCVRKDNIFPVIRLSFCVTHLNYHEVDLFAEKWDGLSGGGDRIEFQNFRCMDDTIIIPDVFVRKDFLCKEGIKRASLIPNGDISACCGGWNYTAFGNILHDSLESIWKSAKADDLRMRLNSASEFLPEVCRKCISSIYMLRGK